MESLDPAPEIPGMYFVSHHMENNGWQFKTFPQIPREDFQEFIGLAKYSKYTVYVDIKHKQIIDDWANEIKFKLAFLQALQELERD